MAPSSSSERLNVKRSDANELYTYVCVCIGKVGVCKRERAQKTERERERGGRCARHLTYLDGSYVCRY